MSSGLGRVELCILQLLEGGQRLRPSQIAFEIGGRAASTEALRASVGRALASLRRKGRLVRVMGDWMLAETWQRAELRREREEERRRQRQAQQPSEKRSPEVRKEYGVDVAPDGAFSGPVDYRIEGRRLIKILALLDSPHDGEVLNAARRAEQIRRRLRLSWEQLITLPDRGISSEETEVTTPEPEYGPNFAFR